jgi:LacI family transcriptional regulator
MMLAGSPSTDGAPRVAVCIDKSRVYGAGVLQGLADYMEVHGPWSVFLEPFSDGSLPWRRLDRWSGQGILALLCNEHSARRVAALKIATVDVCGNLPQEKLLQLGIPSVTSHHESIGRMAAQHLVECGYTSFGFSGYRLLNWVEDRWRGFLAALQNTNVERHVYMFPPAMVGESTRSLQRWEGAQKELVKWVDQLPKPVGIMACNDAHALDLLDACRRARLEVPDAVAIIGVDNDESLCRLTKPELSSIVPDPRRIGYEAARMLDDLMSGRFAHNHMPRILIDPVDVAARLSTQGTAVEDEVIAHALRSIRERACEGVTAEEILRETGLSRRAFYQRFQTLIGRTPHEEISRVRLGRVKRLLRETNLSLEKLAELTGYCSSAHMSVAFRREVGLPPGEFRRRASRPS